MIQLKIERNEDGSLALTDEPGTTVRVSARRCFPWHKPGSFISLRDDDDHEVALIKDIAELDPDSRAALDTALAEAAFVLEVERIEAIDTEFEIRHWKTFTRQGRFSFQTRLDEWPRMMPDGSLLLHDISGNLVRFIDLALMDSTSQKLLWAYID